MSSELDHVLLAVADLAVAARDYEERHGLRSIEGGRRAGWGTANAIGPLGDAYLELVAVVDTVEAARSAIGRWVAEGSANAGLPLGWAVRVHDLDRVAERLSLPARAGSRTTPAGEVIRWRTVGIDQA